MQHLYRLCFIFCIILCTALFASPASASAQSLMQALERVNWAKSNKGLPDTNTIVRTFAVSGKNLYVGVFGAGVFRSTDNGVTWKASNKGLKNFDIWSLTVRGSILYAATTKGLFVSLDNAQSWRKTDVVADIHSIAFLDKTIVLGSLDSILISGNNQTTWQASYRNNKNWFVKALVANGGSIFAGTPGGILRSVDAGATWQSANGGFRYPLDVWALVANNGILFAATADGIYQSTNNGDLWTATTNRENTRSLIAVNGTLYAGAIGAVLRSTDNGASWRVSHEGLPNLNVWTLAVLGKSVFAGTTDGVYEAEEVLAFGGRKVTVGSDRVIAEPLLRATAITPTPDDDAVEEPLTKITIEEFPSDKIHSLLNYIFFDENSAYVPLRYKQLSSNKDTKDFVPERLVNRETLEVYYDVLNVIGYRMQQSTKGTITITGCNAQTGFEAQNSEIAFRRAQAVQQYLSAVWHIPATRILVEARDLPEKPSKQGDANGDQENRRVELYASWDIMKPVVLTDTLRDAAPAVVRLRPQILDTTGVLRWRVFIEQSGKVLKRWAGTGNSSLPHYLDWYISKKQSVVPLDTSVVICQLEVVYKYQSKPVSSRLLTIPIERVSIAEKRSKKANDFAKNRYNLILFDVGSDRLSGVNERIVSSIRNTTLFSTTSSVRILGYTDAVGAEDVNSLLSQRRAESAAQTLAVTPQMVRELIIKGRGEALPLLYENETPEGRFYCRAVVIEIDTPVKYD